MLRFSTYAVKALICWQSSASTVEGGGGTVVEIAAPGGVATSKILSARVAKLSMETVSREEARISCTFWGKRYKNNWRRMLSSRRLSANS